MFGRAMVSCVIALLLAYACSAQSLPSKIDGYKVQTARVVVTTSAIEPEQDADVIVRLAEPRIEKLSILGAQVGVAGEILSRERSGEIQRMRFHDLRVNGIPILVDEITGGFDLKAGVARLFSRTASIRISAASLATGALKELTSHADHWTVTGTALVFGKFKRFGFAFKRVIPVKLDLKVKNPLR